MESTVTSRGSLNGPIFYRFGTILSVALRTLPGNHTRTWSARYEDLSSIQQIQDELNRRPLRYQRPTKTFAELRVQLEGEWYNVS